MERMYVENDQIRRSIYMCCQSVKKYHNNVLSVALREMNRPSFVD